MALKVNHHISVQDRRAVANFLQEKEEKAL